MGWVATSLLQGGVDIGGGFITGFGVTFHRDKKFCFEHSFRNTTGYIVPGTYISGQKV